MTAVDAPSLQSGAEHVDDADAPVTGGVWRRRVLVGLLFVGLVLLMLRPSLDSLEQPFVDVGDPILLRWSLSWSAHTIFRDPLHLFDANIFWPHGSSLAYTDSLLVLLPPFGLLRLLGASEMLAFNLVTLGLFVVALAGTYSLARWLTGRTDAALIAAVAYTFGAYSMAHISHTQLLLLGFFPVAFLLLFRLLHERTMRSGVLFGLMNVAIVLGALYYAAIYAVCVVVIIAGYLLARRFRPGAGLLRALGVAVPITLLAVPFLWPYYTLDKTRPLLPELGLKAPDIVTPWFGSFLYKSLDANAASRPVRVEHTFFPGFGVLALGVIGLAAVVIITVARRRRRVGAVGAKPVIGREDRLLYLWLLLAAGAASVVLALGPEVSGVTMPFKLFYDYVPGFDGIRVASRLAVPGLLGLAVLAAVGFAAITRRWPSAVAAVAAVAVGGFVLLELAVPLTHAPLPADRATLAVYQALERKPDAAVVELPIIDPETQGGRAWAFVEAPRMAYSTIDWKPRFNGYSGDFPDDYLAGSRVLNTFPSPESLAMLRRLHIRYVVLHLGVDADVPQLSDEQADAVITALPSGARVERHGRAWLVDLGRGR